MATLSGTIRDDTGNPLGDATISAYIQENTLAAEDTTASDGTYRLTRLVSGNTYQLKVSVDDAVRTVAEVQITGQSNTRDIDLSASSSTSTTVTSATSITSDTTSSDTASSASTDTSSSTTATSDTSSSTSSISSDTSSSTSSVTSDTSSSTSSVTSDTSSSSVSTATSDSSTSTTTSATTATTATTVSVSVTLAPDPEFTALENLIVQPVFAITPPVNIDEARQARNLMTVGFYIRAGVPWAIANLNSLLAGSNGGFRITLINKTDLITRKRDNIKSILDRRNENTDTENDVLVQVRKQFNQGVESAEDINRDFPATYRRLVGIVADDLMGVTPQQIDNNVVFDATQRERLFNFLRRLKAAMIDLTESLSYAGSLGTIVVVSKWSHILRDALAVIQTVGQNYVASDNVDEKHWVSVLSALINRPVAENRPFLVHAREGGQLLSDVIEVYEKITQQDGLEKEDESFLRSLFYTSGNVFAGQTVVDRLKENGRLLLDNWPANFGA